MVVVVYGTATTLSRRRISGKSAGGALWQKCLPSVKRGQREVF